MFLSKVAGGDRRRGTLLKGKDLRVFLDRLLTKVNALGPLVLEKHTKTQTCLSHCFSPVLGVDGRSERYPAQEKRSANETRGLNAAPLPDK